MSITIAAVTILASLSVVAAGGLLAATLITERLDACHSIAFAGCHVSYTVVVHVEPSVPGGTLKVTATVRDAHSKPVPHVSVAVDYPAQPTAAITTDSNGQASAIFTQRATTDLATARATVPGAWLSGDVVAATATAPADPLNVTYPPAVQRLLFRAGAYAVRTGPDAQTSLAAGFTLLESDSGDIAVNDAAALRGASVLDGRIGTILRDVLCSQGSCHQATPAELQSIADKTRAAVESPAGRAASTVAWEVLPADLSGPLRTALARVHQTLVDLGDRRPTVCSFSLPLTYRGGADRSNATIAMFRDAVRNFDARWCSVVAIAGAPQQASPKYSVTSYDWSQTSVLGPALSTLRTAGWDPRTQPFLAITVAFGRHTHTTQHTPFSPTPFGTTISAQINAYCWAGASSVLAYAWNDGGATETDLSNTPYLRTYTLQAAHHCAVMTWKAPVR